MEPELWQLLGDGEADDEIAAIIRLGRQTVFPPGVRVLTQFGDIITVRFRRSDIPRLNSAPEVAVMEAGDTYFAPDLEPLAETDAETLSLTPRPTDERRSPNQQATGRGVVIGVVDWGFDVKHTAFRNKDGTTRILALWDQRSTTKPGAPQPFGYGILHDREEINAALRQSDPYTALGYHPADADTGVGCHATHVASIAAGTSGPNQPSGIAPGADLVFVHNAPWGENTSEKLGDSVTLLEAVDFIFRTAGDRPCVINLSMGRHGEQHDGSTLIEQGLDGALRAVAGRAICMSNGNYFDKHIHASGQLRPSEQRGIVWMVNDRGPTYSEIEVWYSWRDKFAVEIRGPDDTLAARIELGERISLRSGGAEVGKGYHRAQEPNNLDNHIDIYLYESAPAGAWTIRLIALDVVDGRFHAWIERDGLRPKSQARFRLQDAAPTSTTGTICNGLRTIAVGAYDNHDEDHRIAHFSSAGPTRDGRLKPDLCAPGVSVLAARSSPRNPGNDTPLTTRMSGTSMASPHAAGAVALMFEVAPRRLRIEETHNLLLRSAERFTVQDDVPDRAGIGFLDVDAAVDAAREVPDHSLTPSVKSHPSTQTAPERPAPQPPAPRSASLVPGASSPLRQQRENADILAERTPPFGSGGSREAETETLERPAAEVIPNVYAEANPYPCAGVLSAAGQAGRAENLSRGRNARPQTVGGQPLCPGESHLATTGPTDTTLDLLIWNFDIDGSYLKIQHEAALDQVIAGVHILLRGAAPAASAVTIQLSGFASHTGAAGYNAVLATEREDAVQAYLAANLEKFAAPGEAPISPLVSYARNPGGFDPKAPLDVESAQARSARTIAVPVGAPIPPPRPFPRRCGTLMIWLNAFIPRDVPGYTFTVPAGPHRGKTAIPCPPIGLPANPNCLSLGYLTDQRDFSDAPSASVRMRSVAEIGLMPPRFIRHPGAEHVTSGTTEINKTSGAVTCVQSADMSRCSFSDLETEQDVVTGNYTIKLKLKGAAADPCVNLAADIDYQGEISIFCSPRGNLVDVTFNGLIDSFPAFEMYARLNGVTGLLFRKPPPPGNTVASLLLGASTPVAGRVRFAACYLGQSGNAPQEATYEGDSERIDPLGVLVGYTLASQLARPAPSPPPPSVPSVPDPGVQPAGGQATASGQPQAIPDGLSPDTQTVAEALPVGDAASAPEALSPDVEATPGSQPVDAEATPGALPVDREAAAEGAAEAQPADTEAATAAMFLDTEALPDIDNPAQSADALTVIHRIAPPAAIYDAVMTGRNRDLLSRLGACCQLVAAPGEPLAVALQPGDLIVRRALGEAGVGHVFTVIDGTLLRADDLPRLLFRQERQSDGWLVHVAEPTRGRTAADDLCRVALNAHRRVPFDQLVLRPFPQEQAASPGEASPEGGPAEIPCAADISTFGLSWRETDLKNHRNPRPQKTGGKLLCPGRTDAPERSGPAGQTIKLLLWNFDIDGSYPKRQHEAALDQLIVALHQALRVPLTAPAPASYTLYLSGFASQTGSLEHNTALAVDRERAVERYLRDHIEDAGAIPETPIGPQVKFELKAAGFDPKYPPRAEAPKARSVLIEAVPLGAPRPPPHRFSQRDPTRWLPLVKAAISPQGSVTQGNGVLGLIDGDDTYRQMVADIRSATQPGHFIYLLGWAVIDDFPLIASEPNSTLLKLLETAVAHGVQVRVLAWYDKLTKDQRSALLTLLGPLNALNPAAAAVIVDGIISLRFKGQNTAPIERISGLKRVPPGDIEAALDDATTLLSSHHQKVLVVNGPAGLVGYCGGVDINPDRVRATPEQPGSPMHDVHSRIVGPAAWDLLQTFVRRWDHFKGATDPKLIGRSAPRPSALAPKADALKTLPGTCSVAIGRTFNPVRKGTSSLRERDIKSLFHCAIGYAARHIYIEDQYLVCMETASLLNAAIPRLENLIIVMPRSELSDFPCKWTFRKQFLERLYKGLSSADRNKIVVAVLARRDGLNAHTYIHAKCWFVDDELAAIGSANIDRRGWESDSEVDAFIFDDAVPDSEQLTFAQKMRSLLWAEHLNVPASSVEDASAAAKFWRTPPPGAKIAMYDPNADSESSLYARFCPTLRGVIDPEAP